MMDVACDSLIRQLIDNLPPVLGCCVSYDLAADRFSLLDGHISQLEESSLDGRDTAGIRPASDGLRS
jgi:hypothetical protein